MTVLRIGRGLEVAPSGECRGRVGTGIMIAPYAIVRTAGLIPPDLVGEPGVEPDACDLAPIGRDVWGMWHGLVGGSKEKKEVGLTAAWGWRINPVNDCCVTYPSSWAIQQVFIFPSPDTSRR